MQRDVITWRNLEVEVLFEADWLPGYRETYGYALSRLQIRTIDGRPMPISETGYRSRFERADNIEAEGGPAAYVRVWLDHAAQENSTQDKADPRQLTLF